MQESRGKRKNKGADKCYITKSVATVELNPVEETPGNSRKNTYSCPLPMDKNPGYLLTPSSLLLRAVSQALIDETSGFPCLEGEDQQKERVIKGLVQVTIVECSIWI